MGKKPTTILYRDLLKAAKFMQSDPKAIKNIRATFRKQFETQREVSKEKHEEFRDGMIRLMSNLMLTQIKDIYQKNPEQFSQPKSIYDHSDGLDVETPNLYGKVFEAAEEMNKMSQGQKDIHKVNTVAFEGVDENFRGIKLKIIEENRGPKPFIGAAVTVHYELKLLDGKLIDSSMARRQPFSFSLGAGEVIVGWEEGIRLMGRGDRALLAVGPDKAYGEQGADGVIPPNAVLIFEIQLLDFS